MVIFKSSFVKKINYTEHCHLIRNTYGIEMQKEITDWNKLKHINFELSFICITDQLNHQLKMIHKMIHRESSWIILSWKFMRHEALPFTKSH